jgi:hypothetical protein
MEPQDKELALRAITYGLYILTARAVITMVPRALTESPRHRSNHRWAVGIKTDNDSHAIIESTGKFAVNVLADDQADVAKAFFRTTTAEDRKLNGYVFEDGPETGCPC